MSEVRLFIHHTVRNNYRDNNLCYLPTLCSLGRDAADPPPELQNGEMPFELEELVDLWTAEHNEPASSMPVTGMRRVELQGSDKTGLLWVLVRCKPPEAIGECSFALLGIDSNETALRRFVTLERGLEGSAVLCQWQGNQLGTHENYGDIAPQIERVDADSFIEHAIALVMRGYE